MIKNKGWGFSIVEKNGEIVKFSSMDEFNRYNEKKQAKEQCITECNRQTNKKLNKK